MYNMTVFGVRVSDLNLKFRGLILDSYGVEFNLYDSPLVV